MTNGKTSDLPAHIAGHQSTGAGVPTRPDEFLMPIAKVLDAKSPEVTKGAQAYVKGAEAGDILFKNAPISLVKGETGFLFQPVYRDEICLEWLDRDQGGGGGGGFVARHPIDVKDSEDVVQFEPNKYRFKRTGNICAPTRQYCGYVSVNGVPPFLAVLSFASTGHTVAKNWNNLIASNSSYKASLGAGPADLFEVVYRVRTRLRTRRDQNWYLYDIVNAGADKAGLPTIKWVSAEDLDRGKESHARLAELARTSQLAIDYAAGGDGSKEEPPL